MIDAYEKIYGPVEDRSIFDGEIIVPPHLRNMSISSLRSNRLHGTLFGSLSRSRTFLNLSSNARHTFHGSVPDLSNSNQFTFISNSNTTNNINNSNDRRLSSRSAITKITLNPSTKLSLTNDSQLLADAMRNGAANGNSNSDNAQSLHENEIDNVVGSAQNYLSQHHHNSQQQQQQQNAENEYDDNQMKSNSIRSLNDIKLRQSMPSSGYQSLERPIRALKPIKYQTKPSDFRNSTQTTPVDSYNSEGYMTLIKTNVPQSKQNTYRGSLNRSISPLCTASSLHNLDSNATDAPLQMTTSTSTFQCKPQTANNRNGFSGELSLNNLTNFKLPRVALNQSSQVTNQQP